MSAVVDASVLVAATADAGPDGAWAEAVLAEGEIVCPHLVLVEATNILRRLERATALTRLEATAARGQRAASCRTPPNNRMRSRSPCVVATAAYGRSRWGP